MFRESHPEYANSRHPRKNVDTQTEFSNKHKSKSEYDCKNKGIHSSLYENNGRESITQTWAPLKKER